MPTQRTQSSQKNAEAAVNAQSVHVTYADGTEALKGVSLSVEKGEFFGFLGPNGAGKTTTIKTLATLLHPTQGSVRINGYDTKANPEGARRSIGYMAQETSIDKELTPRENLRLTCELYGVPEEKREYRTEELLDLVDLGEVADVRAEKFSGGMKKRLDAATVLVHRPPVVFLDEPTTGLDPEARLRLWNYFERINDQGTTVFLTTQYLEEADRLCDRISLLQDGQVIATGSPDTLKSEIGADIFEVNIKNPDKIERAVREVRQTDVFADATIETTGEGFTAKSEYGRGAVGELFAALNDAGVSISGFDIHSPTLDDVFLMLTDGDSDVSDGEIDSEMTFSTREVAE